MSILGSRSEIIVGAATGRRTGLIWHTRILGGTSQESHRQVLIADLSTQILCRAKADTLGSINKIFMAANDREDNTGV